MTQHIVDWPQLRADMEVAFEHFDLSAAARKTAANSAVNRATSASACYRAIANSLGFSARTVMHDAPDAAPAGRRASGENAAGKDRRVK